MLEIFWINTADRDKKILEMIWIDVEKEKS